MVQLPKLICVVGPTASGKTALSIKLARKFGGEIVSADSRQIYRGMDIGTAKAVKQLPLTPSLAKEGAKGEFYSHDIKHHLINIRNPNQPYTLAQYQHDAIKTIDKIIKSGKVPFLVGGTGLYVWAVVNNLLIPEVYPNKKLRLKLERQTQKYGLGFLYQKLIKLDPEAAYIVDPKNPRRVIRALEIALSTKKPFSETRKRGPRLFDELILGINLSPQELKKRIEKRTKQMIRLGLVREITSLVKKYGAKQTTFDAIGYREIIGHLRGKLKLQEAIDQINKNSWRFSRRQMTWFRKMPVVWIKNQIQAEQKIKRFLQIFIKLRKAH